MEIDLQIDNPAIIIDDWASLIVNQIDVSVETLLQNPNFNEQERRILNERRKRHIAEIERVKYVNFSALERAKLNNNTFKTKYDHVINNFTLNNQQKLDILRKDLILNDCIYFEQDKINNSSSLLITNGYLSSPENLEFIWLS